MRRIALVIAAPIAVLALVWIAAPIVARAAMRRGMRDLRRNEGLEGKFGDVRRDGAGLALLGVEIATTSGDPVASIGSIAIHPALAWPPARVHVEHARVTQRGLDTWARGFAGLNASWYRKTAEAIARDYAILAGATIVADLDDVFLERAPGGFGTSHGIARLHLPSSTRAELTFDGDWSSHGRCGGGSVFATATTAVDVSQDSLEIRLAAELGTFNPVCRDCELGTIAATRIVPAPGWAAVVGTSATWSGPPRARCLLDWN